MSLSSAMYMQRKSVKTALQGFTASGGCAANSYKFHGNILDAYDIGCELQKKRIECAIMIKAALADEEEKPIRRTKVNQMKKARKKKP